MTAEDKRVSENIIAVPTWPASNAAEFVDDLLGWFQYHGRNCYEESVTQLEHGLQAAWLAHRARDSNAAIAAALLHDVGHLLMADRDGEGEFARVDLEHEVVGARWLSQMFPREVTGPIEGHVRAKRYLCTVDPQYHERLSDASKRSFELQGGPLTVSQLRAAEQHPNHLASVVLRRRDDAAKVIGRDVPALNFWRPVLESLVVTSYAE